MYHSYFHKVKEGGAYDEPQGLGQPTSVLSMRSPRNRLQEMESSYTPFWGCLISVVCFLSFPCVTAAETINIICSHVPSVLVELLNRACFVLAVALFATCELQL